MTEHPVQKVYDDLVKYLHVYMVQRTLPARNRHFARLAGGDKEVEYYVEDLVRSAVDRLIYNVIDATNKTDIIGGIVEKDEDRIGNISIQARITIAHRDFHKYLKEAIKDAYERGVQYGRVISR